MTVCAPYVPLSPCAVIPVAHENHQALGYQPRPGHRLLQNIQERPSVFEVAGQSLFADRMTSLRSNTTFHRLAFACKILGFIKHNTNLTSTLLRVLNTAQLVVLAYTVYFWLITCRIPPNYLLLGTLKRYERSRPLLPTSSHDHFQEYGPFVSDSELPPQRSGHRGLIEGASSTSSPPWYNRRFAEFMFAFSLLIAFDSFYALRVWHGG